MAAVKRRFPQPAFIPPTSGSIEQRVRIIGEAISRKADQTLEPAYTAVLLTAPGGGVWRLSVTDAGTLQVDSVDAWA